MENQNKAQCKKNGEKNVDLFLKGDMRLKDMIMTMNYL